VIALTKITEPDYAANLRRLMARRGWKLADLVRHSGLNLRTLKGILSGGHRPRPQTLHRLAAGLNVAVEEFYQDPALLRHRLFDRQSNPMVEEAISAHPQVFHGWTSQEFDELFSRFGAGGALTREGALAAAQAMNQRRELIEKVMLLMETSQAELLKSMVEVLYRQAIVSDDNCPSVTPKSQESQSCT
jgi:transcriptional regulator with XRE-family HTH domain